MHQLIINSLKCYPKILAEFFVAVANEEELKQVFTKPGFGFPVLCVENASQFANDHLRKNK